MNKSKVYLIGAGPGDASLITVKAVDLLRTADVVLYDYLVNMELLKYCNKSAEKIYVGKRDKQHTYPQEEINNMLVKHANEKNIIVRLKGGDPFVFGRGVEEIRTLIANGIDYEVVPGVTSGVAVPAYMGIPVTARGIASSVAFVTGHSAKNSEKNVNWKALAKAVDTIVIYMGVSNLQNIINELTAGGKSETTPVALIRWGTYSNQEIIKGTFNDISEKVRAYKFKPPALTIIGDVVNFSDELQQVVSDAMGHKKE